ncbi:MAG: ATP-binding protein [Bacteroidales bacterium]|nr:ATP-binding protein [Bacteroidales bacterium]
MLLTRTAEKELRTLAGQFKAVAVVGPRQSGKTTLVRMAFPDKAYVSLENPDTRRFAIEDPRGFIAGYPDGAILDEIQRTPDIFSYLQQVLDENKGKGRFIITGSNNFLLQENISQSLAGRVGYLYLLPLSINELPKHNLSVNEQIHKGFYPAIYEQEGQTEVGKYYLNYIRTYIEWDVRLIRNVTDLYAFERFLRLCAGRTGQLLNMNSLAVETGVDNKTIGAWLSVLEASFVVFRLQPYHKNYNKRIVKMPKLYFYDTGVASALLGIENPDQLALHPFRGGLFENMIIVDFLKSRYNKGKPNNLYFWRDSLGTEIDLLVEKANSLLPIEIKSGQTITDDYFKSMSAWLRISGMEKGWVIYAGDEKQVRSNGITVLPLNEMERLLASSS